jgi:hypothetical protein
MGKRNKDSETDHVLTRAEIKAQADHIAQSVLGLSSRKEAFRMLDRGELTGMAVEIELKTLRSWLKDGGKASDKEEIMKDNDRNSLLIYSEKLEVLWDRLAAKSSEQEMNTCFMDSCSDYLESSYDTLENTLLRGVNVDSTTYFFSVSLSGVEYIYLFCDMTETEAHNRILRYWCDRNDVFLKRKERINMDESTTKKRHLRRKQTSKSVKAPSPTMRISWRSSRGGKRS